MDDPRYIATLFALPGIKVVDLSIVRKLMPPRISGENFDVQETILNRLNAYCEDILPLLSMPGVLFEDNSLEAIENYYVNLRRIADHNVEALNGAKRNIRDRSGAYKKRGYQSPKTRGMSALKQGEVRDITELLVRDTRRIKDKIIPALKRRSAGPHIPVNVRPYLQKIEAAAIEVTRGDDIQVKTEYRSSKVFATSHALSYAGQVTLLTRHTDSNSIYRAFYSLREDLARRHGFEGLPQPEFGLHVLTVLPDRTLLLKRPNVDVIETALQN